MIWAAAKGREEVVRLLVRRGAAVGARSRSGRTALMEACRAGHVGVARILLQTLDAEDEEGRHAVVDAVDNNGNTPLKEAWLGGYREIVDMLQKSGARKGLEEAEMLDASAKCKVGALERLIKRHVDVDTSDRSDRTSLMLGARSGCGEGVRVLLNAGAKVDLPSKSGETALILAAKKGHKRVVDVLLKANADCDRATRQGRTALMEAAHSGYVDVAKALIEKGAEVNLKSHFGRTALILAVSKGHWEIVDALLEAKADYNLATQGGRTALMEAARFGCSEGVRALIKAGADVDFESRSGETALILAAGEGHGEIVDMLLEEGADCDVATRAGRTALMEAAEVGHEDILRSLVEKGADVNRFAETGTTAIMIAVRKGYRSIVEFLVNCDGTNVDITDGSGRTALTLSHLGEELAGVDAAALPAAGAELPEAVRQKVGPITLILLSHGARKGWDGAELILAARARDTVRVQALAQADNVRVRDLEGRTALLIACSKGDVEGAKALVRAGADHSARSDDGRTSLMKAARGGHPEIVDLLLGPGTSVDVRDDNEDTALIEAARSGSARVLRQLIDAGADVGAWNKEGRTPLMEAAENGHRAALGELLDQLEQKIGQPEARLAFINAVDREGCTALDLAAAGGYVPCEDLLRRYGGKSGAEAGLIVYVAPSGECYHRSDCSTIKQARQSRDLKPLQVYDALMQGYDSCARCVPELPPAPVLPELPSSAVGRIIKILFLAANPSDTTRLRLAEEFRSIDQALRGAEFRDMFDLQQHGAVRVTDLQDCLLRHTPDIVHFSGHGSKRSEIFLEDQLGESHPVPVPALSKLFSVFKDNIRCVVLNACYSEEQARAMSEHIDCVVGMSKAIGDLSAISFATAFYRALGYGRDVKAAFDLGCVEIHLEDLNEQDTPQLLAVKCNPEEIVFVRKS